MRSVIPFLLLFFLVLGGCLKREDYPSRPDLEFIGYYPNTSFTTPLDSIGFIKVRFTDGDGDLGLRESDVDGVFASGEPYHFNLFIHYFEKRDGEYVEVELPGTQNVRFGNLTPEGRDKTLEGEMDIGLVASAATTVDTVRFEVFIVDRALNHSDTVVTPDILLPF